jgi:hypothetical protein
LNATHANAITTRSNIDVTCIGATARCVFER